jgi:hypothetical protein
MDQGFQGLEYGRHPRLYVPRGSYQMKRRKSIPLGYARPKPKWPNVELRLADIIGWDRKVIVEESDGTRYTLSDHDRDVIIHALRSVGCAKSPRSQKQGSTRLRQTRSGTIRPPNLYISASTFSNGFDMKREIIRVEKSGTTRYYWRCSLLCGHARWIKSTNRPKIRDRGIRRTLECTECDTQQVSSGCNERKIDK